MAIFAGTDATEESIPLNVVFFVDTGKTTIYNEIDNYGYRVAANEHYARANDLT